VQILLLTPAGNIYHVLTGYVGPDELLQELRFAQTAFTALQQDPKRPAQTVRTAHRTFLNQAGFSDEQIESARGVLPAGLDAILSGAALANGDPREVVAALERGQTLEDHRWAMDHALLPIREFNPESLVGSGQSFFGSTADGVPQRHIGGRR
jgi:hypothetical protein